MNINYQYIKNNKETILFLHGWGADKNSFNFFYNNLKDKEKYKEYFEHINKYLKEMITC